MFRVMTFNIGFCGGWDGLSVGPQKRDVIRDRLDSIVQVIRAAECDIVVLQEVDCRSRRSGYVDQVAYIRSRSGLPYSEFVTTWKNPWVPYPSVCDVRRHWGPVHAGNIVMSRHPIVMSRAVELPRRTDKSWMYNLMYLHQVYHECVVAIPNRSIRIGHFHLDAFSPDTRIAQVQTILEAIPSAPGTMILAGDFNAVPYHSGSLYFPDEPETDYGDDLTLSYLNRRGFSECRVPNGDPESSGYDFPAREPNRSLSYVMVTAQMTGTSIALPAIEASDHRPVVADLVI